jgi:hypothetical protein
MPEGWGMAGMAGGRVKEVSLLGRQRGQKIQAGKILDLARWLHLQRALRRWDRNYLQKLE